MRGCVVDEDGAPLPGLVVVIADRGRFTGARRLGHARTDADGAFEVTYAPDAYRGLTHWYPNLVVTVHDPSGLREVAVSREYTATREEILEVPDVSVPRAHATGWLATLGGPQPARVSVGNDVDLLADGEDTFAAVHDAIRRAQSTISLTQLLFDHDFTLAFPNGSPADAGDEQARLVDALLAADRRGVTVRMLYYESTLLPDDADELRQAFDPSRVGAHGIRVRTFPTGMNVLHAKCLVVDGTEAFALGHPFQQRFWDTRAHHVEDARRGPTQPRHDLALYLRGPVVHDVDAFFAELWNLRDASAYGGRDHVAPAPPPARSGDQTAQVVATRPPEATPGNPEGETSNLEALTRALGNARRSLYVETQYFTSATFSKRLDHALERNPALEVVLVANEHMDIPTYDNWQDTRLENLRYEDRARLGVFSLWSPGHARGRTGVRETYIHSTLVVVDDRWVFFGNANLDGISLDGASELGRPDRRNVELGIVLPDGVDGYPETGIAARVRRDVWAEHLDLAPDASEFASPVGWLSMWRQVARENLAAVREGRLDNMRGRVLPIHPDLQEAVRIPR